MSALIIANTQIRQDAAGRFCLNDLHQASGGAKRHQPSDWFRLKQTQDLMLEVTESPDPLREFPEAPVQQVNDGFGNGTYAVKELVYAYAMWISAAFHLHVIRAYDALVTGQGAGAPPPVPLAPTHRADVLVSASRSFQALLRTGRALRMSHARAVASANAATLRATGIDLVEELAAEDLLQEVGPAGLLSGPAEEFPGAGAVLAWLEGRDGVAMSDILTGALGADPTDRAQATRVGYLLKRHGWRVVEHRRGSKRRLYMRS
ncbi:KilA-N domain-containing protein [Pseudoxanthomonas winnipegensis]|uniref:KilA-N domain-containing protein n=1 Tax=Pseudoxanthomonas winnipegensis TaxID=2480810 RepID=UPI00197DC0B6|nr:KilA-N domain-containing protein [Pseudoxanthomonas winnipegensis]